MKQRKTQFVVTETFHSVNRQARKEELKRLIDSYLKIKIQKQ